MACDSASLNRARPCAALGVCPACHGRSGFYHGWQQNQNHSCLEKELYFTRWHTLQKCHGCGHSPIVSLSPYSLSIIRHLTKHVSVLTLHKAVSRTAKASRCTDLENRRVGEIHIVHTAKRERADATIRISRTDWVPRKGAECVIATR